MSHAGDAAIAAIRALTGPLAADALKLAAELLSAIESARDVLASAADEDSPAGTAAMIAFQLLDDAAASARAPAPAFPAA